MTRCNSAAFVIQRLALHPRSRDRRRAGSRARPVRRSPRTSRPGCGRRGPRSARGWRSRRARRSAARARRPLRAGALFSLSRNSATSAERDSVGSRLLARRSSLPLTPGRSHTEVSWNTAPPRGNPGSALVSRLMPMPSSKAWFGHIPSTMTTRAASVEARAWTTTLPCRCRCAAVAVARPSGPAPRDGRARSAGPRGRCRGVLLKLVLRNERDGAGQAERPRRVAVVDDRDMSGKAAARMRQGRVPPSRRGNGTFCRRGRSRRGNGRPRNRASNRAKARRQTHRFRADCWRAGYGRSIRAGSSRSRDAARRGAGRARRSPHGLSGIRHGAAGSLARAAGRCARRRCR